MIQGSPEVAGREDPLAQLNVRASAARAVSWELPPVGQPAKRSFAAESRGFRVGVVWPAGTPSGELALRDMVEHEQFALEIEEAGLDYVLMTDGWANPAHGNRGAGLKPVLWAVPAILATSQLGVVTVLRTSYTAPMHIARFGSHLDWLSQGRWGWCVVPGDGVEAARSYGYDTETPASDRYAKATEVVDAVEAIWLAREHGVEFDGQYVRVKGRSKRPFTTQLPRPPLFGAGSSPNALALAAARLDFWIAVDARPDALAAARQSLHANAEAIGRIPPRVHLKVMLEDQGVADPETRIVLQPDGVATAIQVQSLANTGLIDGLLIDMSGMALVDVAAVRTLLVALREAGLVEAAATHTGNW